MDGPKQLAKKMTDAISVNCSFFRSVVQGVISTPVDFFYLGYDFIDTENRGPNFDDRERFFRLIKAGLVNRQSLEKIINLFVNQFIRHVKFEDLRSVTTHASGVLLGKYTFAQISTMNIGKIFTSRMLAGFAIGMLSGSVLTAGATVSRAIYTSRKLRERNPAMHNELRRMGNLDLLYFIVEDKVRPFEDADCLARSDRRQFNQICKYFFEAL